MSTDGGRLQLYNLSTGKYLTCSKLTRQELGQLFSTLMPMEGIRELTIESSDLSALSEDHICEVFSRLRYLELYATNLTTAQLSALFRKLKDSTELEEMVLTRNILSQVPSEDLATTISKLRKVRLEYSQLTTEQCIEILTQGK